MKVVIPARYGSTRLPGKPLADIAGKPMIQHVWERAVEAVDDRNDIIIAVDDDRLVKTAAAFGARVVLTKNDHESGTDRIAEVAAKMNWADDEVVVNLQGDEPLMPPQLVKQVGTALAENPEAAIATASCIILKPEDVSNPNIVKVVTDRAGYALYFSRSPIPYDRSGVIDLSRFSYQRHIGLYAYRVATLKQLISLRPASLERIEQLEQLRALAAGMTILVEAVSSAPPHGVDTEADLEAVRAYFRKQS
ncbi:3-deoxy-manno-octulosonate cytidylyltransferase [Kordiimonas pumila]|uniref:3-deoxy-manno-octulosonate cytidylyltransferase n=1 Tax=Kordiimonas pumila TaxID=2161677 RepID=A0ABV7D4L7_9PROT|nr:3-deoxy-manno-octulosonate cytidylyltransferase [Kordiimonas pumila]